MQLKSCCDAIQRLRANMWCISGACTQYIVLWLVIKTHSCSKGSVGAIKAVRNISAMPCECHSQSTVVQSTLWPTDGKGDAKGYAYWVSKWSIKDAPSCSAKQHEWALASTAVSVVATVRLVCSAPALAPLILHSSLPSPPTPSPVPAFSQYHDLPVPPTRSLTTHANTHSAQKIDCTFLLIPWLTNADLLTLPLQRHRDRISHLMDTLRSIIPPSERQDMSSVLERAIHHINHLNEENKVCASLEQTSDTLFSFVKGLLMHP